MLALLINFINDRGVKYGTGEDNARDGEINISHAEKQ